MSEKTRYIDASSLTSAIDRMNIGYHGNYASGQLDSAVNMLVGQAVNSALIHFKEQLKQAIMSASMPYDKCMLCVQRDGCVPPNLGV